MRLEELGVHAVAEVGLNDDLVDLVLLCELGDALQRLGAVPLSGREAARVEEEHEGRSGLRNGVGRLVGACACRVHRHQGPGVGQVIGSRKGHGPVVPVGPDADVGKVFDGPLGSRRPHGTLGAVLVVEMAYREVTELERAF